MWQMHNPLLRRRVASRHGRRRATSTGTRRGVEAARRVPAHRALEPFSNPGTRTGAEVLFGARACRGNGAAGQPAAKRPTRARRHKARSRPARGLATEAGSGQREVMVCIRGGPCQGRHVAARGARAAPSFLRQGQILVGLAQFTLNPRPVSSPRSSWHTRPGGRFGAASPPVPRRGTELYRGSLNGHAATVGGLVRGRESRGWSEKPSTPFSGRRS